jgi:hypothetical protein
MTADAPMRRRVVLFVRNLLFLIAGLTVAVIDQAWAQTASPPAQANVGVWRGTDLSLLDFITDGYDLVSVISTTADIRVYFLTKPGSIVKCVEEATPHGPPPFLAPAPVAPGQAGMKLPTSPNSDQAGTFVPPPVPPGQIGTFEPPSPLTPGQASTSGSSQSDGIVANVPVEFECAQLSKGSGMSAAGVATGNGEK